MTSAFKISQHLYVSKTHASRLMASDPSFEMEDSGGDAKITLATAADQTINEQYRMYEGLFNQIIEAVGKNGDAEVVLSVCVRAYEYVPEINFPKELLAGIARLGASIDVDLIDMIAIKGDGEN